jgi:hypothetical protein
MSPSVLPTRKNLAVGPAGVGVAVLPAVAGALPNDGAITARGLGVGGIGVGVAGTSVGVGVGLSGVGVAVAGGDSLDSPSVSPSVTPT